MKLSASGVEPTFSQGKVTYLTTGLLRQLNNSTSIKVLLKMEYKYFENKCTNFIFKFKEKKNILIIYILNSPFSINVVDNIDRKINDYKLDYINKKNTLNITCSVSCFLIKYLNLLCYI
ncbi:hypothetical protein PFAG_06096 [Plasmodium falciparum Santa Lucia]|uniref:Uncharacterized protein n=1 Tax=Plasmodium falciparum Santa Lucia TaxID=478859 RepID=W7FFP9_PLAFA|nr:hypothetical protein PFAG_06096 [Plasmodium falciparum Santa Lucia]